MCLNVSVPIKLNVLELVWTVSQTLTALYTGCTEGMDTLKFGRLRPLCECLHAPSYWLLKRRKWAKPWNLQFSDCGVPHRSVSPSFVAKPQTHRFDYSKVGKLRFGRSRNRFSFPVGTEVSVFCTSSQTPGGGHFLQGVKQPWREADGSPPAPSWKPKSAWCQLKVSYL